jgi:hypothetical protein
MSIFPSFFRVKFLSFFMFFFLVSILSISNVCASNSTMFMPSGVEVIPVTPSVAPVINIDPSQAIPLGLGNVATGGSFLSISVGISDLSAPVDLYVGLQSNVILGGDLLLFASDNTLHDYSSEGLVKWKSNTTGGIPHEKILPDISLELLPEGAYNFYFLIVPTGGSFNACRLWVTTLNIESPAANIYDYAGNYTGTFWGTDSGSWNATINEDGSITGSYYSSVLQQRFSTVGTVDDQGEWYLSSGITGVDLSGQISFNGDVCKVVGIWLSHIYISDYGSFSGYRQ